MNSSSKVNSPPPIYGHTANLYYNYMIITFGRDIDNRMYNSKAYLGDIEIILGLHISILPLPLNVY
ncbi:hypothetical protein Glove_421g124 [Diversispora epigaea]|uniref:Uncharacterized protein n=1 Tax=Diversispora epigaea TaxID=1348612 RepID=A0A397GVE8_9GLOM|nr:hypothetical protein Glove_421g124 [Diversispora epigaea]